MILADMKFRFGAMVITWVFVIVAQRFPTGAAEPTVTSNDLPHFPLVESQDAVKTIQVKKGFHVDLVASEPNIASPVAVSFDERGRMYVVEMIDYSERREEMPHLGRIRLLEDTDGDGIYDKSTVFAENLAWPTAVFCYDGGILVGATPDILFLKDTNGDGKADTREVLFTGFAEGMKRVNVQGMLNSFIWGLDNRIHGATSSDGGLVHSVRHGGPAIDLHGRDFVIEPRLMTLAAEAGGGQHGLSFDDYGRRFACNNSDHIRLFMYDDRYAARNPRFTMPACLASIAVDGPAAEVYRISPEEPWRVIRTKWRVSGLVPGPIEGGGRSAGYFTGATGTTIYRGDAFPPEYLDNAFVGDAGGNLVHRKILIPDGVGLKAQRGPGEEKVEFLASTDTWFRPVQFANTPDGTLYVIDMHREVIEHPWSLPENMKKFLDLNSGNDRGRIFRVAPDGFKQPKRIRLDKASLAYLVRTLEHPNAWHRETAARLIYERQDRQAIPMLLALAEKSQSPLGRLHALSALDGLGGLSEKVVLRALNDSDPHVREHAIKLCEKFMPHERPSELVSKLTAMANDPAITVRYQLAFTLGEINGSARIQPLAEIAKRDAASSWTQAAILSSLAEGAGELFTVLAVDNEFAQSRGGSEFLRQLVGLVAARNRSDEIASVADFISGVKDASLSFALVRAFGDGLKKAAGSTAIVEAKLGKILEQADAAASDQNAPERTRVQAIEALGLTSFERSGRKLLSLVDLQQPQAVQVAAVATLARFSDPQVGAELVNAWPAMTPRVRSEALAALLARADRVAALLKGIESGSIQPASLSTPQIRFLKTHSDKALRQRAVKLLASLNENPRQKVIEAFTPALELKGDPQHGKKIYEERCISCHRLAGEGFALGPDLVTVKNSGKEKLLTNILDPNKEVRPDYVAYTVETRDDETAIGLIANETSTAVTVRQAYGKETVVPRANIKRMQSQGQSLMPEGLEAGLGPQDLADLLNFIETAN
jgi:putative membrane-bound dehydrogenase-like protein